MDDNHGNTELNSSQIDFDPTPPARVELRTHDNSSSNKLHQRYSMPVLDNMPGLDNMDFEDDDITATIADV